MFSQYSQYSRTSSSTEGTAYRLASFRLFSKKRRQFYELRQSTVEEEEDLKTAGKKKFCRAIVLHIMLIVFLIIYSFIGAAIFQALEQPAVTETMVDLVSSKSKLLDSIWDANAVHTDRNNWTKVVEKLLSTYDKEIREAVWHGINVEDLSSHNCSMDNATNWDFWESLFYSATVYTTIGYGHLSPITTAGKIATMIYALVGIPLCLIVLADLGGLLGELIKYCMRSCKRFIARFRTKKLGTKKLGPQESLETLSGGAVFACFSVIWLAYILIGGAIYTSWEDWSYLDSCYFLFISFSTIGLGDIIPEHPRFFLLSFILIFLGLALVSTGLTIIQQIFRSTINRARDEIDAKLGIEENAAPDEDLKESVKLVEMNETTGFSTPTPSPS